MASKNLWGNLSNLPIVPTPESVLQQQAHFLSELTNAKLSAVVAEIRDKTQDYAYRFLIYVKGKDALSFEVLSIQHSIRLYPVEVTCFTLGAGHRTCKDPKAFEEHIATILGSTSVKEIVARLLSQAK